MPKKKKFIDKQKAVKFNVVHRSQHDPLIVDEHAPQLVLLPVVSTESEEIKNVKEGTKFDIYFDDDYKYLQHIDDSATKIHPSIAPENKNSIEKKLHLPSSVFASVIEEEVGLLNKAAPESRLRLDLDPDIVAAMDDDFDYSNPNNMLEDNFIVLANQPSNSLTENVDYERNFENLSENDFIDSSYKRKTHSCFSDMSCSVISRNSQLTLLDEQFDQLSLSYNDCDIGALECDDIDGEIFFNSPLFNIAAEEFRNYNNQKQLSIEKTNNENIYSSPEESSSDHEYSFEIEEKNKWDCESILSTYSNLYNHPCLIKNEKIYNKKKGIPAESKKLTNKALNQVSENENLENPSLCLNPVSVLSLRNKQESLEEKKQRKSALKNYRKMRRIERKSNSAVFKEKKKIEKIMINSRVQQSVAL